MLYKSLAIVSLLILISSCKYNYEEELNLNDIIYEEQLKEEEFEILNKDEANRINQETTELIEEIIVPDRIFFAFDSSKLSDQTKQTLDNQTGWLENDPTINIIIEGHCDERGTREYNIALGERRAETVKRYLVKNGISSSRIKTISYGKERPAFLGYGSKIWSKNRRAVTIIED